MFENIGLASGDCDYVGGSLVEEFKDVGVLDKGGFCALEPVFERTHVAMRSIGEFDDFGIEQKGTILIRGGKNIVNKKNGAIECTKKITHYRLSRSSKPPPSIYTSSGSAAASSLTVLYYKE